MSRKEKPNIILLILDTLRYDYAMEDTFLSGLTKKGIFFERMYSPSTFTNAVMTSIRTGVYPAQHRWRSWPKSFPISDDIKTLEDYLEEAGYHLSGRMEMPSQKKVTQVFIEDKDTFQAKTKHEPFFLYSHYLGVHDGVFYKAGVGIDTSEKNYKTLIPDVGNFIELAFQRVEELQLERKVLWVITGDHGTGLNSDKLLSEGIDVGAGQLYDFRVRNYSVIMGSDIEPVVLNKAYSLIDLMPTILDYCDIPTSPLLGRSAFRDNEIDENRLVHLEAQSPYSVWPSEMPNVFGVTNGKIKLMVTPGGAKFYDLENDPDEKNNLLEKVGANGSV